MKLQRLQDLHLSESVRLLIIRRRFALIVFFLAGMITMGLNGVADAPRTVIEPESTIDRLPATTPLGRALDTILDNPNAAPVMWGVFVQNIQTGEMLYERNGRMNLMPASNQKLFTTATALDALGSTHRFETHLRLSGNIQDGVLSGDLVIEGSGDPTFGSRRYEQDPLRAWARQLRSDGVQRITGRIIGDGQIFSGPPYAEGWDVSHVATASYAPPAGGLSYRDNMIELGITANPRVGGAPTYAPDPPGYIEIQNLASTSGRQRYSSLDVDRILGTNTFIVTGALRPNYRGSMRLPIHDPTRFTLHAFAHQLRLAGITVDAELVDARSLGRSMNYANMRSIAVYKSPPLSEIVSIINKRSDNFYAEQLFRIIAWGGTTEGGERRVKSFLSRAGIEAGQLFLRDGSGLSRKNMVSAESLSRLVTHMYRDHPERAAFIASLPGGGEPESTMRNRLQTRQVKAKTGSIEFARALSGYTYSRGGVPVAFSIVANNYSGQALHMSRITDEVVEAISTFNFN